jgi:hypothetical protein
MKENREGARKFLEKKKKKSEPFGVQSRPEITPCTRCSGRICWRSAEMPAYATKAASSAFTPSQGAYPA